MIVTVPFEISARGPEALRAYQKALKDGKICDRRVPVMIIGQDRSGKTSLKKSLKGELFNPEEDSTMGIEVDPSLCQVTAEVWKARENLESPDGNVAMEGSFEYHAARLTQKNLKEQQSREETRKRKLQSDYKESELEQRKESIHQTQVSHTRKDTLNKVNTVNKPLNEKVVKSNTKKRPDVAINESGSSKAPAAPEHKGSSLEEASTLPEEIQKLLPAKFKAMEDDDTIEFVLWDFAGQSVFYTTHVLFLSQIAMYILTHDLSKELDAKAVPLVKCDMYERVVSDSKCERTNMDFVHHWLMSVHAFSLDPESSNSESEHLPPKLPAVFLVGTHADKCTNPKRILMEIKSNLEGKSYEDHLVQKVFTVDNTRSGSEQGEDEGVKTLRQAILQVARQLPHVKKEIPLR